MDALTNDKYLRENGLSSTMSLSLGATSNVNDLDDAPDYNEAFPQLSSSNSSSLNASNTFFSSSFSSSLNGSTPNTTTSVYSSKIDEDRRRKLAIHERLATTKIIEIPPDEQIVNHPRRGGGGNQANRNLIANNSSNVHTQPWQKICVRIQKETSTIITFFQKNETLIITITGRPEHVRIAQVHILQELQISIKTIVNIPFDFHKFIIGPRGTTLRLLEQETLTRIAVPTPDSHSSGIVISGAKDNVKLCEQKILELYHIQANKGFERLAIPFLYHPWIRYQLVDELHRQLNVSIDIPPYIKEIDEISIRGEREPVEKAKLTIMQFYKNMEGKIMIFPLEIPSEQHRFILGKKGAGIKEIFDQTNVVVRIPNQDDHVSTIQVIGEVSKLGEAITMIYKMANALTSVKITAPSWMFSVVKGERSANLDILKKSHPDVRIFFRDNHIDIEGPPEDVEPVRAQIQTVIDDLRNNNTTYLEIEIDPQYYKQLIGKNQIRLTDIQEQTGCDIKFPYDESRFVKLMGTKESVEKARQILLERTRRLANERTTGVTIDPQYYPQIIGAKGKKLEEVRSKFHNIQITFPEANAKSDKVILHGDKEDVEKCSKFLQQKVKDLYSTEIELPKRYYPLLIGKNGTNIQRLREQMPDVRVDIFTTDDNQESTHIRLHGRRTDVDKARKILDENIHQISVSLENSIDQQITINSKWHNKFFQNKRRLLNDLRQQYGDVLIKFPERQTNSDQILLRGSKQAIEQVEKHINELVHTWENTITKEISISHRHHGYLLAQNGSYIKPLEKQYNVHIKFPPRQNDQESSDDDTVRIIGLKDDIEQVTIALENMIPIETTVDIPIKAHFPLIGENCSNIEPLLKRYPDVQIIFPRPKSSSHLINLKGQVEQVEAFKKELLEHYEQYAADQQARSFELRFKIKFEHRSLVFGNRKRRIDQLKKKYGVNILTNQSSSSASPTTSNHEQKHDDQQISSVEDSSTVPTELEIIIIGYQDKATECRDEILKLIEDFVTTITMEIDIDRRVHARIIGTGGQKLQQIRKDYNVDIRFPNNNVQSDKVYVTSINQDNIEACIDHLLILEEDFLQDLPLKKQTDNNIRSSQQSSSIQFQQKLSSTNISNTNELIKSNDKQEKQKSFKVKNAPWASIEVDEYDNQQENQVNHHQTVTFAPNKDDLNEYPTFANGISLSANGNSASTHETTVNTIPNYWGSSKRKK